MSTRPILGWLACALATSWTACIAPEVRGQWLVTVRTDAPIPLVGDRVLLEVTKENGELACNDCRRFVDVHEPTAFPVTFGIAPATGQGSVRIRARLYRTRSVGPAGTPPPSTTIDAVARLPNASAAPASPERVALELRMRCFGIAADADRSCNPATGTLADVGDVARGDGDPNVVPGAWTKENTAPCDPTQAPAGMACGPTGLFFLGSALDPSEPTERLVRLDAYYMDLDEFSVGRARKLVTQGKVASEPMAFAATTEAEWCTWHGVQDATHDANALNCVTPALAGAMCAAEGKSLPTEAELAGVAKNGELETRFPWGDDDDVCAHAVVARGSAFKGEPVDCRTGLSTPVGPEPLDTPTTDVNGRGIRRLGGNLSEWAVDDYALLTAPCWSAPPVLENPRCKVSGPAVAVIRGGFWDGLRGFAQSYFRSAARPAASRSIGFRCVLRASR
jgi:formylglycine-generating enzyme required for sulfatase activity